MKKIALTSLIALGLIAGFAGCQKKEEAPAVEANATEMNTTEAAPAVEDNATAAEANATAAGAAEANATH